MKTIHRFTRRSIHSLLIAALTLTGLPARSNPLPDRLNSLDSLKTSLVGLRNEEESLARAITEFEPCLERRTRTLAEIESCLSKSLHVQSSAASSRRLIAKIVDATRTPSLQPLPDSFATELTTLTTNFALLGQVSDRLSNESKHFTTFEMHKHRPPTCDDIIRSARPARSGEIVIDIAVSVCKAVRIPLIRNVPPTRFMTERVSVSFDESEGVHIGQGESESEGHEDGGCLGRGCGDGNGSSYGERGDERGERRTGFDPSRYDGERVRDWARSGGDSDSRPVPLSDDEIMKLERERFEKEVGARTWPVVAATSNTVRTANESLEKIPNGKLYEVASSPSSASKPSRVVIPISKNVPSDKKSIELRLGIARHSLASARPSTWQQESARDIGLAAVDEGTRSLAKDDVADAAEATTIAEGMTDIALGLTPGVGWAKDVIEAVTGRNLVTGAELNEFDRTMAIFGSISLGVGSKIGVASKGLKRIAQLAEVIRKPNPSFVRAYSNAALAMNLAMRLKLDDIGKLWTKGRQPNFFQNMRRHVEEHKKEFSQFASFEDYVMGTHDFIKNPPSGVLKKIRGTDRLFYHPETNTFASATKEMIPKTMFKPTDKMAHWERQAGEVVP